MQTQTKPTGTGATELPAFEDLVFTSNGPVATIQLNRPQVTNALSIRLSAEFLTVLEHIRDSEQYKVVVIEGAGGNFCAGDDLAEMAAGKWGNANQIMGAFAVISTWRTPWKTWTRSPSVPWTATASAEAWKSPWLQTSLFAPKDPDGACRKLTGALHPAGAAPPAWPGSLAVV